MINVTKTHLPDFEKYLNKIKKLWKTHWITNNGEFAQELEKRLKEYLGVNYIALTTNGTLALQIAYKLFGLKNEVITTPFSFVATVSSIVWEGLTPIFSDINPETLTIDPSKIKEKITEKTSAIVPVHVYGNACEIEQLSEIAQQYNLKIIYDAAHCFGVEYNGKSILNYGDASILSFHATKIFHSIEGGAIILQKEEDYVNAKKMINFGYEKGEIKGLGINAKMNEFQAAMGLCLLDEIEDIIEKREIVYEYYKKHLESYVEFPSLNPNITKYNYSYFPIILKSEKQTMKIIEKLNKENIFPRRYFYPSLDTLNYVKFNQSLNNSKDISKRILCLPIYDGLDESILGKIKKIIINNV